MVWEIRSAATRIEVWGQKADIARLLHTAIKGSGIENLCSIIHSIFVSRAEGPAGNRNLYRMREYASHMCILC
jgi:hypothetical protein